MYTCEVCNYALSISKLTSQDNITTIDDPNNFIKIFMKNKNKKTPEIPINMSMDLTFDIKALTSQITKLNHKTDNSAMLIEKFNIIKKNMRPNTFCLKCNRCNETFLLPPGKILSIKLKKSNTIGNIDNIAEIITDQTLPRTKDFICPNSECKTSGLEKEAVIYRPRVDDYVTQYICTSCTTVF
jgi:hypothetical protein